MTNEMKERNAEMKRLRFDEHWTLDKIGIYFGVTRERVRQIVGNSRLESVNGVKPRHATKVQKQLLLQETLAQMTDRTTPEAAEELGLPYKDVTENWNGLRHATNHKQTKKGYQIEEWVSKKLDKLGIEHELTNSRPYDIILANGKAIEVRARFKPHDNQYSKNFWFFVLQQKWKLKKVADFFILVIVNNGKKDAFVIPRDKIDVKNISMVWPQKEISRGKWQQYHNRFDLLQG